MSDNRQRREMAERMALNAPIQGSAADIIKVAMLDVEKALDAAGMRSRMLLQVHDELVFEVAPGGGARRWTSWSGTRWATPWSWRCRSTSRSAIGRSWHAPRTDRRRSNPRNFAPETSPQQEYIAC